MTKNITPSSKYVAGCTTVRYSASARPPSAKSGSAGGGAKEGGGACKALAPHSVAGITSAQSHWSMPPIRAGCLRPARRPLRARL